MRCEPGFAHDLENGGSEYSVRRRKGGIAIDVSKVSARELERITCKFIDEIHEMIGPDTDIPARTWVPIIA